MAFNPRRVPLALLTTSMLLAGACSGDEAPEALPLADDAPSALSDLNTTTTEAGDADRVESGVEASLADLTLTQRAMLEDCATGLSDAAGDSDPASPTYADDVAAVIGLPDSTVMSTCAVLFDPASGIDQGVMISFMIETLPPELILALTTLISSENSPLFSPDVDGEASLDPDAVLDATVQDEVVTLD